MPRTYKEIKFRGKKIRYRDIGTLSRKLRITRAQAEQLEEGSRNIYAIRNGITSKWNTEDKPTFLKQLGAKRISNKKLLGNDAKIKDIKIYSDGLPSNSIVEGEVYYTFTVQISEDKVTLKGNFPITKNDNLKIEDIKEKARDMVIKDFIENTGFLQDTLTLVEITFTALVTNQEYKLQDSKLRSLDISLVDNIEGILEYEKTDENCVIQHLKNIHKRLPKKHLKYLNEMDTSNITSKELKKYAERINCKLKLYDIEGKCIVEYKPIKKSRYKAIIGINWNNHFHALDKTHLVKKKKLKYQKIEIVENSSNHLVNIITKYKKLPQDINFNYFDKEGKIEFSSYIYDDVKYICNDEYTECKRILDIFDLGDKIYDRIKKTHLGGILLEKYRTESIKSFLPQHSRFKKAGYTYYNEYAKYNFEDVKTLDKNKCYPHTLRQLPYLIVVDYSKDTLIHNFNKLEDHYLYIIKTKKSSIILPDSNLYTGKHLKYAKKIGLNFQVLEGITTKKVENCYRPLIDKLYHNLDDDNFKIIMNSLIGQMESGSDKLKRYYNLNKICNYDEAEKSQGHIVPIDGKNDLYAVLDHTDRYNCSTLKPIAIQIKDTSRISLFEKIISLGLKEKDIIQINTDSFSFVDSNDIISTLDTEKKSIFSFYSWKVEPFKKYTNVSNYFNKVLSFDIKFNNDNTLVDAIAGAGKTYSIINDLLPKLKQEYLVMTANHKTIKEYRKNKYNCDVIQKYTYPKTLPEEDIVIIDEHGLIDDNGRDLIYTCARLGKTIHSYGDYTQLKPVNGEFSNSPQYLKLLFSNHKQLYTNYRNHFTKEYYDEIKNGTKEFGIGEVKKHSLDNWEDADVIICYRNDIRDEYNAMKMEYLGFNDISDIGMSVVCFTNRLRGKEIYNKYTYTIVDNKDGIITFDDGVEITLQQLEKNFRPNYATNAYGVQCESVKSYYYCPEDYDFLKPRVSYVVVSRLKTKY